MRAQFVAAQPTSPHLVCRAPPGFTASILRKKKNDADIENKRVSEIDIENKEVISIDIENKEFIPVRGFVSRACD